MKRFLTSVLVAFTVVACATTEDDPRKNTKKGAVIGAATGAVAGAVIGNQSDNKERGAVIGAVVGAGVGAAVGRRMDQQQKELEQIEGVEVTRPADDELNVTLKNDILFDIDSTALRATSRDTLHDVGEVLKKYDDTRIRVEGHADSTGASGYNQRLSERRADSVRHYLMEHGISSTRITAVGYGETKPRASNDTVEGRQLNRRVEIHIQAVPEAG
jgi:outer membrane protein OmpA-like peptidoglycan-associated protein